MKILLAALFALLLFLFFACNERSSDKGKTDNTKTTHVVVQELKQNAPAPPSKPGKDEYTVTTIVQDGKAIEPSPVQDELMSEKAKEFNTEDYDNIVENKFLAATQNPLSTFSIDVDEASYSNVRRFLQNGGIPPAGAVRIEEMINYFDYDYAKPAGDDPFAVHTEISSCPWSPQHQLVHIGLQGKEIPIDILPSSNMVFLVDVSGSMNEPNKLPLVQASLNMLTDQLREKDRVAIVVYAGSAGLVLPSTNGTNKIKIKEAIDNLQAGGSTAGGAGIKLAYAIARENFITGGNNRIILATDGDFNVGASSDDELVRLIEKERQSGVFLSVLGFGMGNYKDNKMQQLADKGNGNHSYIDNINEAKKVLVSEFGSTLFTIAKDVKIQVEFNPAKVQAYRLVGYENRMLAAEDFNDDAKDAGELGSGHTVTALYEIIPVGVKDDFSKSVDPLKYQLNDSRIIATGGNEIMTIKLRYKKPDEDVSRLILTP
jgi:Ca-activated chloride channel family protein